MSETSTIQSFVTKEFLIDIITRDIDSVDAILELVDNSIDRAVQKYELDVTKGLAEDYILPEGVEPKIELRLNDGEFFIEDNCGGIEKDILENEVFVFGNPKDGSYIGLSAFGIGMKRSFFKLGEYIELRTKTEQHESGLIWDVKDWVGKGQQNWELSYSEMQKMSVTFNNGSFGTIIKVTQLKDNIKERLSKPEFINSLKDRITTSYALFIKAGFKILVNKESLDHELPELFNSEEINQAVKQFKDDEINYTIIAGISPPEDRQPRGWYVFCNGRMVLEADKTEKTGWREGTTSWHPKFNHFVGFLSFTSKNVHKLPWSSTKRGIEADSEVYIRAKEEMITIARPILNVLDRWRETRDDDDTETGLKKLLEGGTSISVYALAKDEKQFDYKPKKTESNVTRILFYADKADVQKVKESFGNSRLSNSQVGEMVFEYYLTNEL